VVVKSTTRIPSKGAVAITRCFPGQRNWLFNQPASPQTLPTYGIPRLPANVLTSPGNGISESTTASGAKPKASVCIRSARNIAEGRTAGQFRAQSGLRHTFYPNELDAEAAGAGDVESVGGGEDSLLGPDVQAFLDQFVGTGQLPETDSKA
jgi:hypothetical protein